MSEAGALFSLAPEADPVFSRGQEREPRDTVTSPTDPQSRDHDRDPTERVPSDEKHSTLSIQIPSDLLERVTSEGVHIYDGIPAEAKLFVSLMK